MVKKKACIFISGSGTNLKSIIKSTRDYNFPINIKLVISDNRNAFGINHAKKNSIPIFLINTQNRFFENQVLNLLLKHNISLICLAGYMKIISQRFLRRYGKKIINIDPSLLPKFKGLNTFSRIIDNNEKKTGCTVHYVNEKLDGGNIISQKSFFINSEDDKNSLKKKTQKLEYLAFPEAIIKIYRFI